MELAIALLQPVVMTGASVVAAWFVKRIADNVERRTGVEVDKRHQESLHRALESAIMLGVNKVGGQARARFLPAHEQAVIVREGLDYLHESVPGAIQHFNVGDRFLEKMLSGKLQRLTHASSVPDFHAGDAP